MRENGHFIQCWWKCKLVHFEKVIWESAFNTFDLIIAHLKNNQGYFQRFNYWDVLYIIFFLITNQNINNVNFKQWGLIKCIDTFS